MEESLILRIKEFLGNTDYIENVSTDSELSEAEKELNVTLDDEYKFFVKNFGGCFVGLDIFALKNSKNLEQITFIDLTKSFRKQGYPNMDNKYVISFDGSGNPICINSKGEVLLFDHDIGEYSKIANSFNKLISDNI
jgi:hypothetical protein